MDERTETALVIDGHPEDAELISEALRGGARESYRVESVPELATGLQRLDGDDVRLVFLDLSGAGTLDPLTSIQERQPGIPVIVLSSRDDQTLALQAVREGAQDYLVRERIHPGVVLRVARYAIERSRILSRLRELDQLKSQFVSTVSHEMRTPLAIIREFVSLVRDGAAGDVTPDQEECLDSALRNCDRLTSLITDLLDLSQIESGKLKLLRVKTDLLPILRDCREDSLPRCGAKRQNLELDAPGTLPLYTEGAELAAFVEDRVRVYQSGKKQACLVLLSADSGGGGTALSTRIPRKVQSAAAEVLRSRRDETLLVESEGLVACLIEADAEGAGIALGRVAKALDTAGLPAGRIEYSLCEIKPSGSAPIDLDRVAFATLTSIAPPAHRKRVLVVDDDPAVRMLIQSVLERSGLRVVTSLASSGYQACIEFGEFHPDLVILDLHMPGMSGREVLASMIGAHADRPRFLVVSGDDKHFEEMLALGCDDCLGKPIEERELLKKISRLLQLGETDRDGPCGPSKCETGNQGELSCPVQRS